MYCTFCITEQNACMNHHLKKKSMRGQGGMASLLGETSVSHITINSLPAWTRDTWQWLPA